MARDVYFKTNTLLKNLVGKDLINDDSIAIIELVKNSIDADTPSVAVKFENVNKNGEYGYDSQIVISDNGCGMSESDISDKWLNIAYSEKSLEESSEKGFLAGNKGVGRFSCDRLGEHLDMFTKKKDGTVIWLHVDWTKFELEGEKDLLIQDVPVSLSFISDEELYRKTELALVGSGTILLISGLRSTWNREKLLNLKKSLEKFINPNQLYQKDHLEIFLEAKDLIGFDRGKAYHETVNGKIKNLVFENLKFSTTYIESEISSSGEFIFTRLFHDGEKVFQLKENNVLYEYIKNIKITVFFLNTYKKAYFKRQTGIRAVDFGSIFLFVNGFRVSPYGDRGNDWLGLDIRKAQGTSRYLGNRDVIGRIEITDVDRSFKQVSSREGLIKNDAFLELTDQYFFDVLRKLERFIVGALGWDSVPDYIRNDLRTNEGLDWNTTSETYEETWDKKKRRIARSIMSLIGTSKDRAVEIWFNSSLLDDVSSRQEEQINKVLSDIEGYEPGQIDRNLVQNLNEIKSIIQRKASETKVAKAKIVELEDKLDVQSEALEKLEKETESFKTQTLFLKSVTTLDKSSLLSYHHQICLDSSIIENYIGKLVKQIKSDSPNSELIKSLEKLSKANKRILTTAQYATKANFRSGSRKEDTDIPTFFEQYINNVAVDFVAADLNIEINNSVQEAYEIKVKRIELAMLIDNLISNSNKAHAKNLVINIEKDSKGQLLISFTDDGRGISGEVGNIQDIFEMGVTTTSGSGLGLFHAKETIKSLNGDIFAVDKGSKGFEIRIVFIQ